MGELERKRPLSVMWLRAAGAGGIKKAAAGGCGAITGQRQGRYRLEFLS